MIKITCDGCGKVIFDMMDENTKMTTTISEVEHCNCFDCELKEIGKEIERNAIEKQTKDFIEENGL